MPDCQTSFYFQEELKRHKLKPFLIFVIDWVFDNLILLQFLITLSKAECPSMFN